MTNEEKENIYNTIDAEGFSYCFRHYSSWKEIKDPKFQKLLKKYLDATKSLEKYIESIKEG